MCGLSLFKHFSEVPCHSPLYLIGQNSVTWPSQAAGESGKCSLFLLAVLCSLNVGQEEALEGWRSKQLQSLLQSQ